MSQHLLELNGVHTHIGAYHILHGVDLVVARGQLTMLLGRNGAGKTTTLRTIMGLWHASQGSVVFDGKPITATETPAIASLDVAYVPENMGIFSDLTVKENMLLAAQKCQERADKMDSKRLEWIFTALSGGAEILEPPGGQALGRPKTDARCSSRHCGAAQVVDRGRAQQGSGAGHHQQHD
jgi:branched-chain amino acid transport system ATP-binding protein